MYKNKYGAASIPELRIRIVELENRLLELQEENDRLRIELWKKKNATELIE